MGSTLALLEAPVHTNVQVSSVYGMVWEWGASAVTPTVYASGPYGGAGVVGALSSLFQVT